MILTVLDLAVLLIWLPKESFSHSVASLIRTQIAFHLLRSGSQLFRCYLGDCVMSVVLIQKGFRLWELYASWKNQCQKDLTLK